MKYLLHLESLNLFSNLLKQIEKGVYKQCNDFIWESIKEEGFCDEVNNYEGDYNKLNYSFIKLEIPKEDKIGLMKDNDVIINKYNQFDIYLKDKYYPKYLDLIDYKKGEIYIIKHG